MLDIIVYQQLATEQRLSLIALIHHRKQGLAALFSNAVWIFDKLCLNPLSVSVLRERHYASPACLLAGMEKSPYLCNRKQDKTTALKNTRRGCKE